MHSSSETLTTATTPFRHERYSHLLQNIEHLDAILDNEKIITHQSTATVDVISVLKKAFDQKSDVLGLDQVYVEKTELISNQLPYIILA